MFMVEVFNRETGKTVKFMHFETKEDMQQYVIEARQEHKEWQFFYYIEYSYADIERLF